MTALVVPTDAAEPPSLDEVRAFVAERLAKFKAPRALEIVSSIARTTSGKIRRDHLVDHGRTS